jgi:hypothetical protein
VAQYYGEMHWSVARAKLTERLLKPQARTAGAE